MKIKTTKSLLKVLNNSEITIREKEQIILFFNNHNHFSKNTLSVTFSTKSLIKIFGSNYLEDLEMLEDNRLMKREKTFCKNKSKIITINEKYLLTKENEIDYEFTQKKIINKLLDSKKQYQEEFKDFYNFLELNKIKLEDAFKELKKLKPRKVRVTKTSKLKIKTSKEINIESDTITFDQEETSLDQRKTMLNQKIQEESKPIILEIPNEIKIEEVKAIKQTSKLLEDYNNFLIINDSIKSIILLDSFEDFYSIKEKEELKFESIIENHTKRYFLESYIDSFVIQGKLKSECLEYNLILK